MGLFTVKQPNGSHWEAGKGYFAKLIALSPIEGLLAKDAHMGYIGS